MVTPYLGNTPNRNTGAATFSADTDYYHSWLSGAITSWNIDIAALNTNDTRDTSVTSILIGSGSKSFTVSAGKSFSKGQWLTIAVTTSPTINSMVAQVSSYSDTSLVVDVPSNGVFGSGTFTAWTIALTAAPSTQIAATFLPVSTAATLAASRAAMDVPSNAETMHSGYMQVQDQKVSGTVGGAATAGVNNRTLNTVVTNTITGASVASNIITLPVGTYRFRGESMVVADTAATHVTPQLWNNTVGAPTLLGLRVYLGVGTAGAATVSGRFTLNATTALLLRNQFTSANAAGLGLAASFSTAEVYSNVEIWKE